MKDVSLILIFLFIVSSFILLFFCNQKKHWMVLLGTSLLFYYLVAGNEIWLVLALSGTVYLMSYAIGRYFKIWMAVIVLLIPLVLFKATSADNHFQNYNQEESIPFFAWFHWKNLFQVLGLSYFTFNAISYLIDLNRRYIERGNNFLKLLLYLLYFPAIFSGPLHRMKYLTEQFKNCSVTDSSVSRGLRLILWGLFKNMVIAQRLFLLLEVFYASELRGPWYLLVGLLFFLYLYCNFSSFIDFFRGVSVLFNIEMKNNFRNRVYLSPSRQSFWKGWHITLNEWFRDYFFYVLFRYDKKRKYEDLILLTTFLLIALWHEFSIVMLVWGSCNGLWIILEKKTNFQKWPYEKFRKVAGVFYHLSVASLLALIFITSDLKLFVQKLVAIPSGFSLELLQPHLTKICVLVFAFIIMDYHYAKAKDLDIDKYLDTKSQPVRWFIYLKLALLILLFGMNPGIDNYYIQF